MSDLKQVCAVQRAMWIWLLAKQRRKLDRLRIMASASHLVYLTGDSCELSCLDLWRPGQVMDRWKQKPTEPSNSLCATWAATRRPAQPRFSHISQASALLSAGHHVSSAHLRGLGDRGQLQVLRVAPPIQLSVSGHGQAAVSIRADLPHLHPSQVSSYLHRTGADVVVSQTCETNKNETFIKLLKETDSSFFQNKSYLLNTTLILHDFSDVLTSSFLLRFVFCFVSISANLTVFYPNLLSLTIPMQLAFKFKLKLTTAWIFFPNRCLQMTLSGSD